MVVTFEAPQRNVIVDGRDFLYPVFQFGVPERARPVLAAAFGPAVPRAGDWFGHTVNLASRIADVARAGTVVGDAALREATATGYEWTRLPRHHLRGVPGRIDLHRLRGPRAEEGG